MSLGLVVVFGGASLVTHDPRFIMLKPTLIYAVIGGVSGAGIAVGPFDRDLARLDRADDILRRYNPGVKLIVSLSPVPLHATFRHETEHVVEANMYSKSVLRVAAGD